MERSSEMFGIQFDKARAEEILDALNTGKPIAPGQPGGWVQYDMMTLAGACLYAAMSHGPPMQHIRGVPESKERQEADEDTFMSDLIGAVQSYAQLAEAVRDGHYDRDFEPTITAVVSCQIEGFKAELTPVSGFKRKPK
jgi:hypothetical protein